MTVILDGECDEDGQTSAQLNHLMS